MRGPAACLLLGVGLCLATVPGVGQAPGPGPSPQGAAEVLGADPAVGENDVEETIWSLEREYFEGLYRADYEKVLALTHPAFLGWPDGLTDPIDREGSAAFMRALIPKPTDAVLEIARRGVQVRGGVALTQYVLHARLGGQTRSSRVCHTWILEGGAWRLLGGTSTPLSTARDRLRS